MQLNQYKTYTMFAIKISMSVIYTITTLSCVLPCIFFIFIGKNNTSKKEKLFKNTIRNENVSLSETEQWHNNFIGFDDYQNILVFMQLINEEVSLLKIDLNQIKSCQINKKIKDVKRENKMHTELQSLDLELLFLKKDKISTLNLYDVNSEFTQDSEIERAEKWQKLIQQNKLKVALK